MKSKLCLIVLAMSCLCACAAAPASECTPQIVTPDLADLKAEWENVELSSASPTPLPTPLPTSLSPSPSAPSPSPVTPAPQTFSLPEDIRELAERLHLSESRFTAEQLILVSSAGSAAVVTCYDRWDETFVPVTGLENLQANVGTNGVTTQKSEGDGCTPAGLYFLGFAFGTLPDPGTALEYRPVTEHDYWVDDPESEAYNCWASDTEGVSWTSAEHLSDYPGPYAYSIVIRYNMDDIVPGAGSAIFFHCGLVPTAGCVCVSQENMKAILLWLRPGAQILIA